MSPADLDGLLRNELTRNAEPLDDLDTRAALAVVLEGSARRTRRRRAAYAVAATVVVIASAVGVATLPRDEASPRPVAPVEPHGGYERTVTAGQWQGDWSISLDDGHVLGVASPPDVPAEEAPTDGASYRVSDRTLTLDAFTNGVCSELALGTYTWTRVGEGLLLQPVREPCTARREVFAGLWQPTS
ncbi:MAG: hypothetical protein ACTHKG_17875 [Nocardioides sp.]